ncbi:MAG: PaaI family thioesterase [Alphaproteobacteria bacterium]
MDMPQAAADIPPGFVRIPTSQFVEVNGPFYGRMADGKFTLGLRIEERHCNQRNVAHGGMLMTFADMTVALGANFEAKLHRFLPTIKLEGDFLAPVEIGSWLEGRAEVLSITRNMVFAAGMLSVAGKPVARVSAIMKLPSAPDPRWTHHRLFA